MSSPTPILPLTETVTPADENAVAGVLRRAWRNKTAVYPVGGGTSLAYGLRPSRPGVGLLTTTMNHIVDHPAADLTVTVEAGLTLAELNRRLAAHRQWLPLDVPLPGRATIGGMVASNACGPRRYAYGSVRDYLLAVRAVDGRGEVFSGGNRVVKSVAGYNIPRLLAGSLGTLGVITQATLLVRPMPASSALVLCDMPEFEDAEQLLMTLSQSQTFPVAVELLAGRPRREAP